MNYILPKLNIKMDSIYGNKILHLILLGIFLATNQASEILHRHVRITGGQIADITQFPYQVSVIVAGLHLCGGCIISKDYVITSAHCIDGIRASEVEIQAGSSMIGAQQGSFHKISQLFEHPNFSLWNYEYDIALLKLENGLEFNSSIEAVNMPDLNAKMPPPNTKAIISGWGYTAEKAAKFPTQLMFTEVQIISFEECLEDYKDDGLTENMFCAGFTDGVHDACFGDSGGPLVVNELLYGIVSWGHGCGQKNHPGVYTSVIAMRKFIKEVTGI